MRLGTGEILIILVVVLLVFGVNKIPQLGDALGRGIRNFKKAADELNPSAEPETRTYATLPAARPQQRPETGKGAAGSHALSGEG